MHALLFVGKLALWSILIQTAWHRMSVTLVRERLFSFRTQC